MTKEPRAKAVLEATWRNLGHTPHPDLWALFQSKYNNPTTKEAVIGAVKRFIDAHEGLLSQPPRASMADLSGENALPSRGGDKTKPQ